MRTDNSSRFLAVTIVARNYLAHARVLARSFAAHHPGESLTLLLIDDPRRAVDPVSEPFSVLHLDEIVAADELARLRMIYDVKELATAVKPLLLQWAISQGAPAAIYLDPDIEIFAPLDGIAALAEKNDIVLTPHSASPMPQDGRRPSEADILAAGVYNLGFLGVSSRAGAFLDWWWERLRRHCVIDPEAMLFVDQRWVDFVPAYFPHMILRDPGSNVAYWNIDGRKFTWTGDRYTVDGVPLRFFHFSGFSLNAPWMLTEHFASDRTLLSEHTALRQLCNQYAEKLMTAGYQENIGLTYEWSSLPVGLKITPGLRRMYRLELIAWEAGEGAVAPPPPPFHPGAWEQFFAWLIEPVIVKGARHISRYLLSIYHGRPDLQAAYPDLAGEDFEEFLRWVATFGVSEYGIPDGLMPPEFAEEQRLNRRKPDFGANVVGYLRAELGVGEAGRLVVAALSAAGVPQVTRAYEKTISRQQHHFSETRPEEQPYSVNVICINADQMEGFRLFAGGEFFADRYTVGLWFWEVEEFPSRMCRALDYVHEVWVASDFVGQAIAARTDKPVTTVDLPILPPPPLHLDRERLGLPDRPVFLYMYDFMSVLDRKNPLGVIDSFGRAFIPFEGPGLVLKSINGDRRRADLERVRYAAGHHPDIIVRDGYVSPGDRLALIKASDCYVSLHRSEGFGLTLAEAMSLGTPVIATGYSGNMAFMRAADSFLVDYSLVPVAEGCEPYPPTARWADPDLDQAAAYMRLVVDDPEALRSKGAMARDRILSERSPERAGAGMRQRLEAIHRTDFSPVVIPQRPRPVGWEVQHDSPAQR